MTAIFSKYNVKLVIIFALLLNDKNFFLIFFFLHISECSHTFSEQLITKPDSNSYT